MFGANREPTTWASGDRSRNRPSARRAEHASPHKKPPRYGRIQDLDRHADGEREPSENPSHGVGKRDEPANRGPLRSARGSERPCSTGDEQAKRDPQRADPEPSRALPAPRLDGRWTRWDRAKSRIVHLRQGAGIDVNGPGEGSPMARVTPDG